MTKEHKDFDTLPDFALLDTHDIIYLSGRSRSSIVRDCAAGLLAPPVRLGSGSVRWRFSDVKAYLDGSGVTTEEGDG